MLTGDQRERRHDRKRSGGAYDHAATPQVGHRAYQQ